MVLTTEYNPDDFSKIVLFLVECKKKKWDLDEDDIGHVLTLDFDYIRKQQEISYCGECGGDTVDYKKDNLVCSDCGALSND